MQNSLLSPPLACSICNQELTPPTSILSTCGHVVHKNCFENLPASSVSCPSCSKEIYSTFSEIKPPAFFQCSSCGLAGPSGYFRPVPPPTPFCDCCNRVIAGMYEDASTDRMVTTINNLARELIQRNPEITTDGDFKELFFKEVVLQGEHNILSLLLDHQRNPKVKEELIFSILRLALSSHTKNNSPDPVSQTFEIKRQATIITLLKTGIASTLKTSTIDQEIVEKGASAVEKLAQTIMERDWANPPALLDEIFFEAVVQKEDEVISALLKRKISPYTKVDGKSAFDTACQLQHISILAKFIMALLKSKTETASCSTSSGVSLPLALEALIEDVTRKAPSINIISLKKELLFETILQRNPYLCKFLLSKGISPNTTVYGKSIFDKACEQDMRSVIGTLFYLMAQRALKKGVRFQSQTKRILDDLRIILDSILATDKTFDRKSLMRELISGSVVRNKGELCSFLLHSDIFPEVTIPTDPLLQEACNLKRYPMVFSLLRKWIEQTLGDKPAQPIICENVCSCIEKMACQILDKNPTIDAISLKKHLLFSAIEQKDEFLISTLLRGGVHPTSFLHGISPLQKAYESNRHENVVLLIKAWIERELCGKEVQDKVEEAVSAAVRITQKILTQIKVFDIKLFMPTLLFGAVQQGDELLVSALLRGGIPPNVVVNGKTSLSEACDLNRQPIVKLLLKSILQKVLEDAPDQSKVPQALCTMELIVNNIFETTIKIDSTSLLEKILFEAVIDGNETLVAALLKAGVSPYTKVDGVSAMKKAEELKRENIVSLLLRTTFVLKF